MIALITPTGARKRQITLCAMWMLNQTYTGEVVWAIVDDCVPETTDFIKEDFRPNWKVVKVHPKPEWQKGQNTQARNLLAGIEAVKPYKPTFTFVIEDDDYYKPCYLTEMMKKCKSSFDVVGERFTVYYNVVLKGWRRNGNKDHASLFQTAFSPKGLDALEVACKKGSKFIDLFVFRTLISRHRINLFEGLDLAIGIKGLPGRPGIGVGHKQRFAIQLDKDMTILKKWVGDDYIYYL
jgi:hypothetical protein